MATLKYGVRDLFDAWYDEESGWFVNESCSVGIMEIDEDCTDDEIFDWLVDNTRLLPTAKGHVHFESYGDTYELVENETDRPLYGFYLIYS